MTDKEYENVKKFYQTMKLNDFDELNIYITSKTRQFFVKYLNSDLNNSKSFLNIILVNVILQVYLVVVLTETKANV